MPVEEERVGYNMGGRGYVVGKFFGRKMSPRGVIYNFKEACIISQSDIPSGPLEQELKKLYLNCPNKADKQFLMTEFMSPQPVRFKVEVEE